MLVRSNGVCWTSVCTCRSTIHPQFGTWFFTRMCQWSVAHLLDNYFSWIWHLCERKPLIHCLDIKAVYSACHQFWNLIRHRQVWGNATILCQLGVTNVLRFVLQCSWDFAFFPDKLGTSQWSIFHPHEMCLLMLWASVSLSKQSGCSARERSQRYSFIGAVHRWTFPTWLNIQLSVFVPTVPDTLALEYEALSMDWTFISSLFQLFLAECWPKWFNDLVEWLWWIQFERHKHGFHNFCQS